MGARIASQETAARLHRNLGNDGWKQQSCGGVAYGVTGTSPRHARQKAGERCPLGEREGKICSLPPLALKKSKGALRLGEREREGSRTIVKPARCLRLWPCQLFFFFEGKRAANCTARNRRLSLTRRRFAARISEFVRIIATVRRVGFRDFFEQAG